MSDTNNTSRPASDGDGSPEMLELERRRKTMRRILAGGGLIAGSQALPDKWAKPVIDSLVLPVHAAASPVVTTTATPTTTVAPTTTPDCTYYYGQGYYWDGQQCVVP